MEQTAETADNLVNSVSNQTDQTYTPAEHGTAAELTGGLQKERPSVLDTQWTKAQHIKIPPSSNHPEPTRSKYTLPQAVAHRGYKGRCPENSMLAFETGIKAGADGLECDMHLTKDGVVVVNHDKTLKRCHGVDKKVIDCDWDYVRTLRSLDEPHVGIPRLCDMLEWLAVPEREHIWVYIELKLHDDAETLVKAISEVFASVPSTPSRPWTTRITFGIWTANYLIPLNRYLPTYPISLLTPSLSYASCFLTIPQVTGFSVNYFLLYRADGLKFLEDARAAGKAVYAWTVNKPRVMNYAVHTGFDGVVTDEVDMYLKIREEWQTKFIDQEAQIAEGGRPTTSEQGKHGQYETLPLKYRLAIKFFAGITNLLGNIIAWKHKNVLTQFQVKGDEQQQTTKARVPGVDDTYDYEGDEASRTRTEDTADSRTRLN